VASSDNDFRQFFGSSGEEKNLQEYLESDPFNAIQDLQCSAEWDILARYASAYRV
jgi:hypothetical protein